MMDALNILRAVLVACAFVAALLLSFRGMWIPAVVLFLGIVAHLALFLYLHVQRRHEAEEAGLPAGGSLLSG